VSRDKAAVGHVEALCLAEVPEELGRAIALNGEATAQPIIRASEIEEKERREDFIAIFLNTFDKFYSR
jgi:hypothetical protein